MNFNELKEKIKSYSPNADFDILEKTFQFAEKKHIGHKRESGDPYITHPLAVAFILADLEQDITTICAAILHDTMEDSGVTIEEIKTLFSSDIAQLVYGVTKLSQLVYSSKEQRRAENFRKMFMAMAKDLRVIIIKLADRLHNMQTLQFLPLDRIKDISLETREIFAPLAHRLGMWRLKWELEDLSFKYIEPEKYKEIQEKVAESRISREIYIKKFIEKLSQILLKVEIIADIKGRPKHLFSIYGKMVDQNLEFDEIYDLTAIRVIVGSIKDCYAILGIVHASWKPIPGRFRDYIAVPKSNGYQSLHTTVIGDEGKPVEVQIRTKEMHRIAEYGVAAHWVYKETATDKDFDKKMSWFRRMLENQNEISDARDFLDSVKIDLFIDEVFVFTPKGQVIQLPVGSTPIDFAYHVHTEVGHRCAGSKVNGKIVPLDYKLKNGDIIEIITGKFDAPSPDWLNFAKTSGARTKIKSWFKKVKREESIERGRALLEEELRKIGLISKKVLMPKNLKILLDQFKCKTDDDFYASIGFADISAFDCARRIFSVEKPGELKDLKVSAKIPFTASKKRKIIHGIKVAGLSGIMFRISKCCKPIPGDEIIGFVSVGKGVAIHRKDCENIIKDKANASKLLKVEWDFSADIFYSAEIEIEAFDRVGVLKDILTRISDTKTNVSEAKTKTKKGNIAFLRIVLDVKDVEHLQKIMQSLRDLSDVYEVRRCDIINH